MMSAKSRCKKCSHRMGRRVVSATTKLKGSEQPQAHKKPCGCCHGEVDDQST